MAVNTPKSTIRDRLDPSKTPKKMLSLDGGGILGMLSVEFLAKIESLLRAELKNDSLVLGDYFDYIAGTSTGAIIATCLSWGMSVDQVRSFYEENGREMFDKQWLHRQFLSKYSADNLAAILKRVLGERTEFGDEERLRTLLLVVLKNASTDSPWPLSNNPLAKYNDRGRANCNLKLPLWQIVRASTAAPTYFPPEVVTVGGTPFVFVDGGVTVYNNPAFQLFRMATLDAYKLGWKAGEKEMLLVSIGTGAAPDANPDLDPLRMNLLYSAQHIPSALISAAVDDQDFNCRVFGRCVFGPTLDRERGDLVAPQGAGSLDLDRKLFTYIRYNVDLTAGGLADLGLPQISPAAVQAMDAVSSIPTLKVIGRNAAERDVKLEHFRGFVGPAA